MAAVDDFLHTESQLERQNEINRVLNVAFKLNPFDVLNLSFSATDDEVRVGAFFYTYRCDSSFPLNPTVSPLPFWLF